ncbi:choice-of-anchor D domain-containing protein [Flavobacterium sp. CYK-55]|uniref:choice-of-anchor D domain-containing protein n=1 Tax=Flavobacterium sp. CYK-55 TaxID=2835529 RepID=UPI001BCBAB86|nr:choice-of-anchor D domain-containing protein [Flavobacterium sp. CYK-55]MBS7787812.1 choice-of-anchor D domain-containing protein [Flavobacterium sp. CYK-55]
MKIKLLITALLCSFFAVGQYSITGTGSGNTYTQNFDAFRGTALTLPANWTVTTATYNATYPIITSGAATPTVANASGNNCYAGRASSVSTDYAILQKQATSGATTFTFSSVNNTGAIVDGFVITWNVEQYNDAGRATTVAMDYRIGAAAYSTTGISGTNSYTATTGTSTLFNVVQTARSITISGLSVPNGSTVDFRFSIANGVTSGSNAHIGIDDFTVYATSPTPSSYSGVTAGASAEPATISSLVNTLAASSLNFDFLVTDDANTVAANDALPTLISQIVIPQGTGNDIADWTQAILGAELSDGTNTLTGTVNATNLTFSGINTATLGNVADGGTKTYRLKIWLRTALGGTLPTTIDGLNFAFKIDRTNFTTANLATSTQFESGAGTVVESGGTNNQVTVVATKIVCTNTPGATQYVGVNFTTLPTVYAQDANGNQDLNYASNVTITNAGSLGMSNVPTTFSGGVLTFPANFQYTAPGNGTLTINANPVAGITPATTSSITVVTTSPEINILGNATTIVDGDSTPTTADWTVFPSMVIGSTTTTRTFTIQNTGTASLTISGISFSGVNAADYTVTTPPTSPVAAGSSTTFTVTFNALTLGASNATLTITNNDVDESTYDFSIQGTSTASSASDILAVALSEPATIASTINDAANLTSSTGIQVWQFQVRDGGASADADNLSTILTDFTITKATGNQVTSWSDAIKTVALFDGATRLANGVVNTTAGVYNITFSGLNVVVADNTQKTLSLRLSLNCGIGATNFDGDDFGFSITNALTIFSSTGSGKTAFGAQSSANSKNIISVTATKLAFTQQPTTTGAGNTMTNVIVAAQDACGNLDKDYTGSITISSTGTMSGGTMTVSAVAGLATFTNIIHTVVGTGFVLNTSSAFPVVSSSTFDIIAVTVLNPGDLAILAVNTTAESSGSADEISFVCFQDLLPGTTIYLTDNGYERVTAGLWGNTEGIIMMTRTNSLLPKGTIVTIHTANGGVNDGTDYTVYTCGSTDANWNKSVASSASYFFDLNKDDQVWICQGGTWGNVNTGSHDMTYNGNVLYGWTDIPWKTAPAWDIANGTKGSTIFPKRDCFTTDVANLETGASQVKFNDPVDPDFSTTTNGKYEWIALINNPANWNYYSSDVLFDSSGYNYLGATTCPGMIVASDVYVNGKWTGFKDTNWFNCGNWDTLLVPDATVDVQVGDNVFNRQATIDATAQYAAAFGNIATAKNLTVTGEKVEIIGNANNKLEVHGNVLINGPAGYIDMDDSNPATADGQIYLYGTWTNNIGSSAFDEGNGTVQFVGTGVQTISSSATVGTETFYNVILDNNFDTATSNDLIASGTLTVNAARNVNIDSAGYIIAGKKLSHNGNLTIANNGQLVQIDEANTNDGTYTGTKFQVNRTAQVKHFDYVYWGSPVKDFPVASLPNAYRFEWNTLQANANGTTGNWIAPTTLTMTTGKGYIARASNGASTPQAMNLVFQGEPNNGQFTFPINRGTYVGPDYDADPTNATNALTTQRDDNWNLLGNPYPSAIDAEKFLVLNQTKIEGTVWIWKHGLDPAATGSPFYNNYQYNYSATSDLIKYNGLGSSEPDSFAGSIASGQGFLVAMLDSAPQPGSTVTFSNDLRRGSLVSASGLFDNTDFFRMSTNVVAEHRPESKSRIWLDVVNQQGGQKDTALIGYSENSTLGKDHMYDCMNSIKNELTVYSLIDADPYIIQGRPLPFDVSDVVPMGVKIANEGAHTIAIRKVDGLFETTQQNIYIEDKQLGLIHDLRQAPYNFTSPAGRYDDRFVLRYTNEMLSNPSFESNQNVVVLTKTDCVEIHSYNQNIQQIEVYDVLGRSVFESKNIDQASFNINTISPSNQVLMVEVKLKDGTRVVQKIIY